MHPKHIKAEGALMLTALVWGSGFISVDLALSCGFKPGLIVMMRFSIGALILLAILNKNIFQIRKSELKVGAIAGLCYFFAFYLQTIGLQYTNISNNAILTATNILMVPFISWLVFKEKPGIRAFIAVFVCFFGIAVLTWSGTGFTFNIGDALTLLCALACAAHIAYLGVAAKGQHPLRLTFVQMVAIASLSVCAFFVFEGGDFSGIQWRPGLWVMLYTAFFPTTLCLFLQTYGQKYIPSAKSAILLSFESFYGAALSVLLGFERLTINLLIGGSIIIATVIWLEWQSAKAENNHKYE